MIIWMLYSTFVALSVALAARAAEWLARLAGFRVRWIWAGALALVLLLSASPLIRRSEPAVSLEPIQTEAFLDAAWLRTVATVRGEVSPAADGYALGLSALLSVALVLVLGGVARRIRRASREWPLLSLHGSEVRLAPRVGPLVIGLRRPEIVIPRWLLARPAEQQRLVVTHEAEHVRARDHLLLGFGWSAVIVAPWNPVLWYMLSRLRLAVELDCDARVIRRGALPHSYGSLLIDVARHASALRPNALALADDASHLRQRILAMTPTVPRFSRLRAGVAAAFTLAGLIVACRASIPSDPVAEQGEQIAAQVAEPETSKTALPAAIVDGSPGTSMTRLLMRKPRPGSGRPFLSPEVGARILSEGYRTKPDPVIFLDGKRVNMNVLLLLDRTKIESIEVLKGPAAARYFADGEANVGVVVVTTKRAP